MQHRIAHQLAVVTQSSDRPLRVNRIPRHDGCRDQIDATGATALLFEATDPNFTQAVEEHPLDNALRASLLFNLA